MNAPGSPEDPAAMSTPLVTAKNVDLSNCDRELIQYSGAIQPHGVLLVLEEPTLRILQASANTATLCGIAAEALLGQELTHLFGTEQVQALRARLGQQPLDSGPVYMLQAHPLQRATALHLFAHRVHHTLLLECEVLHMDQQGTPLELYSEVRRTLAQLQATESLQAFFALAVAQIRLFTGFERVMAYKFHEDGSGEVIAEALQDGLESYLGLHYPAVDIPEPARRLFALRWLSHLPDVGYIPVPIVPEQHPGSGALLDLSYSFLRSVSVMYTGYLRNMGVKATMVMTLLKNGKLWGLISCMQHSTPRFIPYESRMACEFLAHMVSLLMAAKEDGETYEYRLRMQATLKHLVSAMSREDDVRRGLVQHEPDVRSYLQAQGAAVVYDHRVTLLGQTPTEAEVRALAEWVSHQEEVVFATHHLAQRYPAAEHFRSTASGLLVVRLSQRQPECLMWFRPEVVQTVQWAGDPTKPVEVQEEGGEVRLIPRTSFALWKETVYGTSRPWQECELQAAADLRRAILEHIVERAMELARLNRELQASNLELDSFAYVASHDLKEPLRGIHNYAQFLKSEAAERLQTSDHARLETILRLTQRMDELIESLLQYSRVGRIELNLQPINLQSVLRQTLEQLHSRIEESGVTIRLPQPLPTVTCDLVRVSEIFHNLLTNAIKYNDKAEKWVEVGVLDQEPPVFYVRDNGIGIEPEYHDAIFQIFRRLHPRDAFGGGAGAGLTITRRTIERHGGELWLESSPGKGSTFYFTLAPTSESTRRLL